jgi:hypothetical protein
MWEETAPIIIDIGACDSVVERVQLSLSRTSEKFAVALKDMQLICLNGTK